MWVPPASTGAITAGGIEGVLSILGRTAKSTGKEEELEAELQKMLDGHVSLLV